VLKCNKQKTYGNTDELMSTLIYICICIIACAYVYSYYLHPASATVLQVSSAQFTPTLLLDKQPVVIDDAGGEKCMQAYRIKKDVHARLDQWCKNKYKYLVFTPSAPCDILASPAIMKCDETGAPINESSVIAFRMRPGHTLILPFHWMYYITDEMKLTGIHDLVTYFLP
jgi:hypothetical protein